MLLLPAVRKSTGLAYLDGHLNLSVSSASLTLPIGNKPTAITVVSHDLWRMKVIICVILSPMSSPICLNLFCSTKPSDTHHLIQYGAPVLLQKCHQSYGRTLLLRNVAPFISYLISSSSLQNLFRDVKDVVCADHEDHDLWINNRELSKLKAPKDVVRFIPCERAR